MLCKKNTMPSVTWRESVLDMQQHSSCTFHACMYVNIVAIRNHGTFASMQIRFSAFSSISLYFLADFMCKGVRKAFQYALKNGQVILTLICKGSNSNILVPFGHSWIMLDTVQHLSAFPYPFSKSYFDPIIHKLVGNSIHFQGLRTQFMWYSHKSQMYRIP